MAWQGAGDFQSLGELADDRVFHFLSCGSVGDFPRIWRADAQNPGLYAALLATIHLMLFAIVVRLYSASTTRDYLFLTLMAFTSMLASAILTVDTVFLVFFFLFLALAVSTFVGLEMWRSAQGAVTPPLEEGTAPRTACTTRWESLPRESLWDRWPSAP